MEKKLLDNINYPSDLKKLKENQLKQFCDELRSELIEVVSETGGHLGAGLGVVELTTAIHALDRVLLWGHYVIPLYHSPIDSIAYWNFLEYPKDIPLYGIVIETRWSNLDKAKKLNR